MLERNKESFKQSHKAVTRVSKELLEQVGVARLELSGLESDSKELEEKIATLEESNERLAEDLHLIRRAIESVGQQPSLDVSRSSGSFVSSITVAGINSLPPFFRGSISSMASGSASRIAYNEDLTDASEVGSAVSSPLTETQRAAKKEANDTLTPLLSDSVLNDQEKAKVEGKLNKSRRKKRRSKAHAKISTMTGVFTKEERSIMAKLIYQQEKALKGDLIALDGMFEDESDEEEKNPYELVGFSCDKSVIDWNVKEVMEFFNVIDKGSFSKFIPEFKKTMVTGEVLLSLQRTELKHEYRMNREEITILYNTLFLLDPNFKDRMIKKYKKKKALFFKDPHRGMIMSTVDWDTYIQKNSLAYSWNIVKCLVGDIVQLRDGREGRVLYVGETEFAEGKWIGIELFKGEGLNDGKVRGVRYFQTQEKNQGVFVRQSKIKEKLDFKKYQPQESRQFFGSLFSSERDYSSPFQSQNVSMMIDHEVDNADQPVQEEEWNLSTSTENPDFALSDFKYHTTHKTLGDFI